METNTKINIPPPSVQKDEITISGDKDGVAVAKEKILMIYKDKVGMFVLYSRDHLDAMIHCLPVWKKSLLSVALDILCV